MYSLIRIVFHVIMCFELITKHDICGLYNNVIQCVIDTEKNNNPTTLHTNKRTVLGETENVES